MTRYELGFLRKCAEQENLLPTVDYHRTPTRLGPFKLQGNRIFSMNGKNISAATRLSDTAVNNALLGATIGGIASLPAADNSKEYLKTLLKYILIGGTIGLGASAFNNMPDITKTLSNKIKTLSKR